MQSVNSTIGCAAGAFVAILGGIGQAASADLQVFSSGAPAEVQKVLAAKFSQATGNRVALIAGTIAEIQEKLKAGARPDIVVLPAPALDALEKTGALHPGTRVVLARVGVGVVVRDGAP